MKVKKAIKPASESRQIERQEPGHNSASSRPWQWLPDEGQFIVDSRGNIVAEIPCQGCNPADGAFIVTAVNSYDALREALNGLGWHSPSGTYSCWCHIKSDFYATHTEQCTAIRAALSLVAVQTSEGEGE